MIDLTPKKVRKGSQADKTRAAFLAEVRKRFTQGVTADATNRATFIDNLKAVVGLNQWDDRIKNEREANGRPCLNFNQLPTFINQIVGDQRESRPACKVRPSDNKATVDSARVMENLIRAIEADSHAEVARDKSFDTAVKGNHGARRIITEYESDDSFNQVIKVKPIRNPLSVVWDPLSVEWDKGDAEWLIIYSDLHKDIFEEKYPDATMVNFDTIDSTMTEWYSKDKVRVAEYFKKKSGETKVIVQLKHTLLVTDTGRPVLDDAGDEVPGPRHGEIIDKKDAVNLEPGIEIAKDESGKEITRVVKSRKIVRYMVSGSDILEDEQEWPSKYWPVIPVEGRETDIEGKVYKKGLIDEAKDSMKSYNLSRNSEIETYAMAPKAPVTGTPKMFQGHEASWDMAHKKVLPRLLFNADSNFPGMKPERLPPPELSTAITQSTIQAREEMKGIIGIFNPGPWEISNEVSGRALDKRQHQSDVGSYEFIDNLSRSLELEYRIYIDLIPHVYDTQRAVKLLHLDGTVSTVNINEQVVENGERKVKNDLTVGRYDVIVTMGPNFSTQRQEAVSNMISLLQAAPQIAPFVAHLMVKNMDFADAQDLAKYLKMGLFPKQFLKPEEMQEMSKEFPNAFQPQAQQMLQKQILEGKAQLDMAKAGKAMAETAQIKEEIGVMVAEMELKVMEAIDIKLGQIVGMGQPEQGGHLPQGMPPGAPVK